ncbi:hypothetical protein SBBP1_140002 [Burkholderiales bacterium]|nr:hypothetical protein SBBP1_140002 [Burkholderiales bacterium]
MLLARFCGPGNHPPGTAIEVDMRPRALSYARNVPQCIKRLNQILWGQSIFL